MKFETKKARLRLSSVSLGLLFAMAITLFMCCGSALLIDRERVGEGAVAVMAIGIVVISSFAGAMVASKGNEEQKLFVCLISGTVYLAALFAINGLFFDGTYGAVGGTALIVIGCALGVSFMGIGQKRHKFRHSKVKYHR